MKIKPSTYYWIRPDGTSQRVTSAFVERHIANNNYNIMPHPDSRSLVDYYYYVCDEYALYEFKYGTIKEFFNE